MSRYYIDTCIWMDVLEIRIDAKHPYFSETSTALFKHILKTQSTIIISDVLVNELSRKYNNDQIKGIFIIYADLLERVQTSKDEIDQASNLSKKLNISKADVLHCFLAKRTNSSLVTRDRHFKKLITIWPNYQPEQLI